MFQKVDLHTHSTCSDGSLSPEELVNRAHAKGVDMLALTDHDTVSGLEAALFRSKALGVKLVSGVEFSCVWGGATVHVLGLGINVNAEAIVAAEKHQAAARIRRSEIIADKLSHKYGMVGLLDGIEKIAGSAIPARPHIAKQMVEKGYCGSVREAFSSYLGAGKIGDVKTGWPELEQVLHWIHQGEGVSVVAHPRKYKFTLSKLRRLLDEFKSSGGEAIEVSVGGQKQGETGLLTDLCQRYGFFASAGSDFHTPGLPWSEVGNYPKLPDSITPLWQTDRI